MSGTKGLLCFVQLIFVKANVNINFQSRYFQILYWKVLEIALSS